MHLISEAAEAIGVSPKALRHWDAMGLLVPRREGAYRVYSDDDLKRGASIALFQTAGIPLAEIAPLLDAPPAELLTAALRRHRRALQEKARLLKNQVRTVDQLIKEANMDKLSTYLGEHMGEYQREAEERWGGTREWARSQNNLAAMGGGDIRAFQEEQEEFAAALTRARESGVAPGSEEADALVLRHREALGAWYPVTAARQLILARMYVEDERFHAAYAGEQDYLLRLVEKRAEREGVDLAQPAWD
ncbi:MerR family transcriptional regulator [Corynebacterium senegalense]|uniref:MerR family transcriptional regulator n=1 Tax=Corynebacterium senegalense TaxID=2080750 RepID=UPI000E20840A|nr:MerR family transcriptional regulator [Corynebacterium senegalense]